MEPSHAGKEQPLDAPPPTPFWVVGIDGSTCSEHAARWATRHVSGRADLLKFVAAWTIPNAPALPPVGPMARYWDIDTFADAAQERLAESVAAAGMDTAVTIEPIVTEGQSASVLMSAATDASLLVVGNRGHGGFKRLLLGSTSTQCATHARVPTAVIPCDASIEGLTRIVVAIDGSTNSLAAAAWALRFATSNMVVEFVSVWDVTPVAVGADQFFFPEAIDLAQERFEHQISVLRSTVCDRLDIRATFVRGHPRGDLEAAAEGADLFVMGARGHGAVGAAVLGSVSTWLLHNLACPMIVIPSAEPDL